MAVTPPDPSAQFNVSNPNNQKTSAQQTHPEYHRKTKEVATPRLLAVSVIQSLVKKHNVKVEEGKGLSFLLSRNVMKQTANQVTSIFEKRPDYIQKNTSSLKEKITPPVSNRIPKFL